MHAFAWVRWGQTPDDLDRLSDAELLLMMQLEPERQRYQLERGLIGFGLLADRNTSLWSEGGSMRWGHHLNHWLGRLPEDAWTDDELDELASENARLRARREQRDDT